MFRHLSFFLGRSLILSPVVLAGSLIAAGSATGETSLAPAALPQASLHSLEIEKSTPTDADRMFQVTSVSQLTDVKPTDWAFQALQSLVERYGCIVGYPDKTFRGNQALTRYEFAAGLNACMDRISELIAAGTADLVKKEDLLVVQRLQEEFAAELAALRGRVEALETRTATLEKQQFSTTTKLEGEAVFALAGIVVGDNALGEELDQVTVLGDRIRLNFDTSFTGEDLLRVRLQAGNLDLFTPETLTRQGALRFNADSGNQVGVDALLYQFPIGNLTATLQANAGATDDFIPTLNPYLDGDGGSGALTHFGTRNAIYYLLGGAGLGLSYALSDQFELGLGYLVDNGTGGANLPFPKNGLFDGPYGAIAQLTFKPNDRIQIGAIYVHSYKTDFSTAGETGTNQANFVDFTDFPFAVNAYGLGASFQISPQIVLNGAVGYTNANSLASGFRGKADIWNWFVGLAFPDLFSKGSLAGLIVGMEPYVTGVNGNLRDAISTNDSSLHVEGFYQYQITDNIAITPGIVWITAPNGDNSNADIVTGVIRTTFTF